MRTMTNVGDPRSTYHAVVSAPRGISVTVTPEVIYFENYGAKRTFTVSLHVDVPPRGYVFGYISWHGSGRGARLTMPLVVKVQTLDKA